MSKLVPPITIELDRTRQLVCDMTAIALIAEWTGVDMLSRTGSDDGEALAAAKESEKTLSSAKGVSACLAALLSDEDPEMTPRKAGRLIDSSEKLALASGKITEAIERFSGVRSDQPQPVGATVDQANP